MKSQLTYLMILQDMIQLTFSLISILISIKKKLLILFKSILLPLEMFLDNNMKTAYENIIYFLTDYELLTIKGLGKTSRKEIADKLKEKDLSLHSIFRTIE